jgi:hypothetical protein
MGGHLNLKSDFSYKGAIPVVRIRLCAEKLQAPNLPAREKKAIPITLQKRR